MNLKIEKYLKLMGKQISSKSQRISAQEEIRNHLYDHIDSLVDEGGTFDKAVEKVLSEATDSKQLGKKLNIAHRPIYLRYPLAMYSLVISMGLVIIVVGISYYSVNEVNKSMIVSKGAKENYKHFFEDIEQMEKRALIKYSRKRNANNIIYENLKVYSDQSNELFSRREFCKRSKEIKRCFLKENIKEYGTGLVEKFRNLDYELTWVDSLMNFDHWNFFEDQKILNQISQANGASLLTKIKIFSSLPVPDYAELNYVVALRLVERIKEGEFDKAERIADHVTQLQLSSNVIIGAMNAANFLSIKNLLIKKFNIQSWKTNSIESINLIKRIGWGWVGAVSGLGINEKYANKVLAKFKPENASCYALFETIISPSFNETFFLYDFPFEPRSKVPVKNFRSNISKMVDSCGVPQLRAFLTKSESEPNSSEYLTSFYFGEIDSRTQSILKSIPIDISKVPFVRVIVGSFLGLTARPNHFDSYARKRSMAQLAQPN